MRFIYETAKQVVVWLGPETGNSTRALKFVDEFHRRVSNFRDPDKFLRWIFETAEVGERPWDAVTAILLRPWWTRAWTFQEILVSKSAVVQCGQ